jgi:hypothetical protein
MTHHPIETVCDGHNCATTKEGKDMRFNSTRIVIDATPRRADGEYMAHARISSARADGTEYDIHLSGDLAGFDVREDAIAYAKDWAQEWLDARFG